MDERTSPTTSGEDDLTTLEASGGDDVPHDQLPEPKDRADRVAERIAVPILIAALASVPAVFLTLFNDPYQTIGEGLNTLSGGVLVAETVVLFAVSENRWEWVKRNKWLVLLALAIIPAVVFAIGPVQLLRLLRVAGALRIIRVGRIFKAGKIVRERAGLEKSSERLIGIGVTVLCAVFVAVMLVDPTTTAELSEFESQSRTTFGAVVERLGWIGVVVAGAILAAATYVVWSNRKRDEDGDAEDGDAEDGDDDGKTDTHQRGTQ